MRQTRLCYSPSLWAPPSLRNPPASVLAPTGSLRATFLGMNPVQGRVDPQTGVATGLVPDLIKELAARLGVPYRILPAPDAAGVIGALKSGAADIGFLAYDETRAREVEFGAALRRDVQQLCGACRLGPPEERRCRPCGPHGGCCAWADAGVVRQQPHEERTRARIPGDAPAGRCGNAPDRRRGGRVRGEPTAGA